MASIVRTRITTVWLLLMIATALSLEIGHGVGIKDLRMGSVAILVVAMVKVRFVIFEFMEIHHAPQFMRILARAWVLLLGGGMIGLYWMAAGAGIS